MKGGVYRMLTEKGHLSFELSLSYRGTADYDTFRLLADNRYIPKGNY